MKVAVVGVTGMVGQVMLKVLKERNFNVRELIPAASPASAGKEVTFGGRKYTILDLPSAVEAGADIALFSAGGSVSREWAPRFADRGTIVIDNSSAWRMEPGIPLVIPEINPDDIKAGDKIIANPNCSTIQMLMALAPLHRRYGINRIVVSTYQSVTGSGVKASRQLAEEVAGITGIKAYPHPIYNNILPHCADFESNDYTTEEMKLVNETRKILGDDSIRVSATAVRVPVTGGHSESVNVEFHNDYDIVEVRELISSFPGVVLQDNPSAAIYPMPVNAWGRDEVFVGRVRRDHSNPKTLNLWVVSDNIRKGAATNAVQIAELLVGRGER